MFSLCDRPSKAKTLLDVAFGVEGMVALGLMTKANFVYNNVLAVLRQPVAPGLSC